MLSKGRTNELSNDKLDKLPTTKSKINNTLTGRILYININMSMWYDSEMSDIECIFTYIKFRASNMVHLEQTVMLDCIVGVNC